MFPAENTIAIGAGLMWYSTKAMGTKMSEGEKDMVEKSVEDFGVLVDDVKEFTEKPKECIKQRNGKIKCMF